MKFTCSICGQEHEDWPALAYSSPTYFDILSDEDKKKIAQIDSDFCIIKHQDQTDRFIRCTLFLKIIDYCEYLDYGLWVSLSEESFKDYSDNFNNNNHEVKYFGWLSNSIPGYEDTLKIPTTIFTKKGNSRPEIVPNKDFDHPFVRDYYNGIPKSEAEKRIKNMLTNLSKLKDK